MVYSVNNGLIQKVARYRFTRAAIVPYNVLEPVQGNVRIEIKC